MGNPRRLFAKRNANCLILGWRMDSYRNALILCLFLESSGAAYVGQTCSSNSTCWSYLDDSLECMDGLCKCPPSLELRYSSYDLEPDCDKSFNSLSVIIDDCKKRPLQCNEYEECVHSKPLFFSRDYGQCRCKEGYIRVGTDCRKVNHQSVLKPCYIPSEDSLYTCDISANSYCKDRKCICFDTFFANTTSGYCELMSQYIKQYNLTSYQVKPEEYCTRTRHCISGLTCQDFKCKCPLECPYKPTDEICDCGLAPISEQNIYGPLFVGIFVSILIMAFWTHRIRKTIERQKKKLAGPRFEGLETVTQDSPSHNTYSLTPVNASTEGNVAASPSRSVLPSSTTEGRQSPLPPKVSNESLPPKYEGKTSASDLPPYQPPVFGFSTPNPLESFRYQPPPPYTEKPLDASAPPYALTPLTGEGSSHPEAGFSPSAPLPYDVSPSVPPSTNPSSSLPYPSSPSSFPSAPDPTSCPPDTGSSLPYALSPYGASSSVPTPDPSKYAVPPYNPSQP